MLVPIARLVAVWMVRTGCRRARSTGRAGRADDEATQPAIRHGLTEDPMSYPEARYDGDAGEVSATFRPADAEPEVRQVSGTVIHYLARGAETGGLFGLYRYEMAAARGGPGPHFHRTMTESFYVLSGEVAIYDGRAWRPCRSGDFVHVPIGGIHGFRNESGEPASMLIHFAPGGPREAYFEGLAEWGRSGRPDDEAAVAAFYREHDNIWLPDRD
jgi:quercetin dioxygenase-like cupin family protein